MDRLFRPIIPVSAGTDQMGRDLFSRLIVGARLSILVGLAATTLNVVIAVPHRRHFRIRWW